MKLLCGRRQQKRSRVPTDRTLLHDEIVGKVRNNSKRITAGMTSLYRVQEKERC